MFCKARITDKTLTFQDGKIFHTTTECGGEAKLTVKHEDGESSMSICGKCLKRYIKKKEWYGWFDDVYPKDAPVKGSQLYRETVKLQGEPMGPQMGPPMDETFSMTSLAKALPGLSAPLAVAKPIAPPIPSPPAIPSLDSLHTIEACKEARLVLRGWIKGEGAKKPGKLQPYYKADMDISAKMKRL
jgi:hypothetical protein